MGPGNVSVLFWCDLKKYTFLLQIWISPERVGEKTGCLAFIGISRPYFAITNKTRVQGSKIRNKYIFTYFVYLAFSANFLVLFRFKFEGEKLITLGFG